MTSRRFPCAIVKFLLLIGLFFPRDCHAEPTGKHGRIQGETHVNLRSGPDLNSPSVAVLKQGSVVTVEGKEGSWYHVSLSDGTKGYIHQTLIHPIAGEKKPELPHASIKQPTQSPNPEPVANIPAREERDWQAFTWGLVLLCIFVLGWILGGKYYLRRDHVRRRKLQL